MLNDQKNPSETVHPFRKGFVEYYKEVNDGILSEEV